MFWHLYQYGLNFKFLFFVDRFPVIVVTSKVIQWQVGSVLSYCFGHAQVHSVSVVFMVKPSQSAQTLLRKSSVKLEMRNPLDFRNSDIHSAA